MINAAWYYTLLVAAGGGGGAYHANGGAGSATAAAGTGAGGTTTSNAYSGGGGAGINGAGASATNNDGGRGGSSAPSYAGGAATGTNYGKGGFGGGGSAGRDGGGGGGGYSGGNGGSGHHTGNGTGGTSFLAALADSTNTVKIDGQNTTGAGKVVITPDAVCYVTGTLIRTARGDVAVEALAVGDLVVTASGAHRPIRWIGHRDTDCARHPEPRKVWPVRVRSGALGAGLPYADLWFSPGHALCLDEVLIPVRCLVHGDAISQVGRDSVTYWHVELDTHDILIANGVPAESYLATGNRSAFDNAPGPIDLHPDFEPRYTTGFCRPYVQSGPLLSAARARLFGGAAAPVSEPIHMLADGIALRGMVGRHEAIFLVPAGTRDLRLVSPSVRGDGDDIRRLGLNINALRIEDMTFARAVALDDPTLFAGFHDVETDGTTVWRWTDGDAHFAPNLWEGLEGAFLLRIGGMFEAARGLDRDEDRRAA